MNLHEFKALCEQASRQLGLLDVQAMGEGADFYPNNVPCTITLDEKRSKATLICELDDPRPDCEADVYRQLLELQSIFIGQIDAMFIREPVSENLLFIAGIVLHKDLDGARLGQAIDILTKMVAHWREGVLKGMLIDNDLPLLPISPAQTRGPRRQEQAA